MREAELSMERRLGAPEVEMLTTQSNLASTYEKAERVDEALSLRKEVYSKRLKLSGEEDISSIIAANNYGESLVNLGRFEEAKALLRKTVPVARRVLGEDHELTLRMSLIYGWALSRDAGAALDDLREAVTTLEDAGRIARRVFGGAHPLTAQIEKSRQNALAALRARETSPTSNHA